MTTRKNSKADATASAELQTTTDLPEEACPKRRLLISAATLGGTAAAVVWRRPVIDAVLLPAHAQTTGAGAGGAGGAGDGADSAGGAGGSGGGEGSEPEPDSNTCPNFAVSASGSETEGLSASSTGGVPGAVTTFYVVAYDSSGTIVGSFFVDVVADASGAASISLTPAELDSAHGITDLGGKTFQISVESADAGCNGTPPQASVFIAPGTSSEEFTVGGSSAGGDGGANLVSCGSEPGTFVEFTITVKDKSGGLLGESVTRNGLVQSDGCTLPLAYTFAELDEDFKPSEPYDICIDGLNDAGDTDTTIIVL